MELVLLLAYARMILRNPLGVMMESQLRVMMESVLRVMMEPATHARNGPPRRRVMIVFGRRTGALAPSAFPLFSFSLSVVSESGALHVFWCRAFVCCRCCFSVFFFFHQFARETGGRVPESLLLLLWLFCFVLFFSSCVCRKFFQKAKQRREEKRREEKGRKEGRKEGL